MRGTTKRDFTELPSLVPRAGRPVRFLHAELQSELRAKYAHQDALTPSVSVGLAHGGSVDVEVSTDNLGGSASLSGEVSTSLSYDGPQISQTRRELARAEQKLKDAWGRWQADNLEWMACSSSSACSNPN